MLFKADNLPQLRAFSSILDARTPDEYRLDHIPSAINAPTLSNEERILIGTTYKQLSAFEAKKRGGAMAARNIATHIETLFLDKPKTWKPLVYCWRGGNRSGSMVTILRAIGWQAQQLEGGHKAYRKLVVEALAHQPQRFQFEVLSGPTGSGKSLLLDALAKTGAQVLDLEALAQHRGSVLGRLAGQSQPSQKWFESQLAWQLVQFDPQQPIFVEAESKKIGQLFVPDGIMEAIQRGRMWEVATPFDVRVAYLLAEYEEYVLHPERLLQQISYLSEVLGKKRLADYRALIEQRQFAELVALLLTEHYDPLYAKAQARTSTLNPDMGANPLPLPALASMVLQKRATEVLAQAQVNLSDKRDDKRDDKIDKKTI
jgi:tRNA 2-selenouridine synthase